MIFFAFFFQAEDGIRDADVTGVQTCALPISAEIDADSRRQRDRASFGVELDPPPATTWRHGTGRGGHVDPRPAGISVQPRQLAVGPETAQPPLPLREK